MAKKGLSRTLNTAVTIAAIGAAGAAISEQLRRPPEERTWHGKVMGVPYDFRIPTTQRVRDTFWNKNTSEIFVPHAFGIGWSINFYPLVHPKTVIK